MWRAELKKAIPTPVDTSSRRAPLAHGLGAEPVEERRHLLRRGKAARVGAQIGERALERRDLERWDVDQAGGRAGASFERRQELVDRAQVRLLGQHACDLQLPHEGVEVHAAAVGDVGSGGEEPERREPECGDRAELDDVAGRLADGEARRIRLVFVGGTGRGLDAADQLDRDAEQVLGGRLVEPRPADEARQNELGGLVHAAADEREDRAHGALGKRGEEGETAGHR